jgi:hypothetical protein
MIIYIVYFFLHQKTIVVCMLFVIVKIIVKLQIHIFMLKIKKNEWHLFYGNYNLINSNIQNIEPTIENLIEHYFNTHIIQKTPKYTFFNLEIMSSNGYYEEQKYDNELALGFTEFLKLYLSNFISNVNVEQNDCPDIKYINGINHIEKNNVGIKIMFPIDDYNVYFYMKNEKFKIITEEIKYNFIKQIPKYKYIDNTYRYIIYDTVKQQYIYMLLKYIRKYKILFSI